MEKFMDKLKHFMIGRYGIDQLSVALLIFSLVLSLLNGFIGSTILTIVDLGTIFLCYFI